MGMLLDIPYMGASCDYLYARLRCRQGELDSGGLLRRVQTGDPRQALLAEYRWLYRQTNQRMRRKLRPVFEYFELRLLVVALRYLAAGDRTAVVQQLQQSLFHPRLRNIVQQAEQPVAAIRQLERLLGDQNPVFQGLAEIYLRQGPGGLEQALIGGSLQQAVKDSGDKQVRGFLRYLLDMRNLQALHKHLHWQVPSAPPLLTGGTIELAVYEKIWAGQDLDGLLILLQKFTRLPENPEENIEDYLLQGLTKHLRQCGREPLQIGQVLDYLWRCQQATRLQGLQQSAESARTTESGPEVGR